MKYMDKGISIAIPTYDSNGEGAEFIRFSLDQIKKQSFKDLEVIISDDSNNDNSHESNNSNNNDENDDKQKINCNNIHYWWGALGCY